MYYGYNHPRIGPTAMPSPSSKCAPYYSGRRDTFEEFLAHFEALADDHVLSDAQRVKAIVCYMAPSVREILRSVDGFCSRDWSHFRQFLVDVFGIPHHLVARQKLLDFVQNSSRKRMFCEDDVLQYYRQFSNLTAPIFHTRHLSKVERDAAFWCGFHPKDRSTLRPALLAKYPYQPHDEPFPFDDVLSCARAAFAYHDPFPSWSQEKPYNPQKVRREQPAVEHVSRDTYGFRLAPHAVASNAETTPSNPLSPSQLTTDPQFPFPSSVSRSELYHTSETAPMPSTPPSSLPRPIPSSASYSLAPSVTDDDSELTFMPAASSILSAVLESPPSPMRWTTEDHLEPDPVPSTVPISHSLLLTPSLAPSATNDNSKLMSAPPSESSTSTSPLDLVRPPSLTQLATDVHSETEPELAFTSPDSRLPSLSSPTVSESQLSHATADSQLEPIPASPVSPPASLALPSPALLHTPQLALPLIDDKPEPLSMHPSPQPVPLTSLMIPSLELHSTPSPSEIPSLEIASSPKSPSPPLDYVLATSTVVVDSDTVPLSSPERPPSSLSDVELSLSAPLKFSPSVTILPCPSPIDSTPTTPPGLLKSSPNSSITSPSQCLLRLSPNSLITPPSLSPLEATQLTTFGPISPPLVVPPDVIILPHPPPSLSPQRPPRLMLIGSQTFTPLNSPPSAPSTQPVHQMSIPVDLPFTPLQIVSFCSPSHSGPGLAHVNFPLPFSIPSISVSDLGKTLSTHAHELQSKREDLAGSRSDAAKTRDVFAYRFQLGQYTPHLPSFVFDPGGLASALDPTHEYTFKRNTRSRGAFTIASSITVPAPLYVHRVKTFAALVTCSTSAPSVFDKSIPSTPPPLTSSPRPRDPIPVPLTSFIYAPSRSFGPSHSSLTDVSSSCPPSFPLVKESTFRYAPYLDPRLLCHICLFRPCFLLIPFITSLVFPVSFVLVATALGLLPSPSPLLVRPSLTQTAHARHRKTKTRGSLIITHDTSITTVVQGPILIHFGAETPAKLARRSLTGDGQDFDPPGGVRLARALAPKSSIFGLFDFGPASRGLLPFRIRVLTASRFTFDSLLSIPSSLTYTHTPPARYLHRPWSAAARTRLTRGFPAPHSQAARPRASCRLCPSTPRSCRIAHLPCSFQGVKIAGHPFSLPLKPPSRRRRH
ncbi:hypothetical protein EDB86DRAFT_1205448 [Lactarius hatsudake]|nr:hypothetical protein EDB86DRAFT_1205448 [Lactarius hatsudake]